MHCALENKLWIGNALEARNPQLLFDENIEAVVDLAMEEEPASPPREIIYCRFPLIDGGDNPHDELRTVVETVRLLVTAGRKTLICCGAGLSRSPCVAAAVLTSINQVDPEDALASLANKEHSLDTSLVFWRSLKSALQL